MKCDMVINKKKLIRTLTKQKYLRRTVKDEIKSYKTKQHLKKKNSPSARDKTQGLIHAKQVCPLLNYISQIMT